MLNFAVLDRPVWHSLGGPQQALDLGGGHVRRLDPAYGPFAAAVAGAEADLSQHLHGGEIWLVEPEAVPAPKGLQVLRTAPLLQMIADGPIAPFEDAEIVPLGEADAAEMAELAIATEPGPWASETWRYGQFYGIRIDGRLAAMAGERMRPAPHLAEVSGVCTWPEFRGRGLAARLIRKVMAGMAARGEVPYLHSYATNASAIRLYESLGFRARRAMVATLLGPE
ncbi:GNAT family N-acetyltransferase [Novosphingobium sp. 1Y9A]|uniref:GNAT family N-acetyltransferase n=2 Tax=Novosphingobium jiangmenense TaxID=2791981 RepID=A0ABS0HHF7_9SPHN|nr:GNAT family N-acetyltransferase [Novosphingobium jiangmenense]MBF9151460.1 GNAT family N-acetyltransferase [Novosphingobium jiangmenense]